MPRLMVLVLVALLGLLPQPCAAQPKLELVVQTGHTGGVSCVAFSVDGGKVLTGSWDKTAILWDAASGQKLQTFQGHTSSVSGVALSGDGRKVLTGSWDKTAILWDAASGQKLQTFQGHTSSVSGVALSADGRKALTRSGDKTAILWDAASGQKLQTFQGHTSSVSGVALSGDGRKVLTGSADKTAILWDAASGQKLQTFLGHTDAVYGVGLSGDGRQALTGSADKTAILWDAASGQKLQTFQGHTDAVYGVGLSGDGRKVLTGSGGQTAILWDAATGQKLQTFQGHTDVVTGVALSGDGRQALTGSADKTAILWDAASGQKLQTFQGHTDAVMVVALSGDGRKALTGTWDGTAVLWDAASGHKFQTFQGHTNSVSDVGLSGDGRKVLTGSFDGTTRLWDAATGKELCRLISIDQGEDWLVVTPDGLFDGSPNAAKFVSYRIAGTLEFVPLERYRKQFERPGLLAALLKGEDPPGKSGVVQDLPPTVRITAPARASLEIGDGKLTVEADAESRGQYPVTQLRLLVNGRPYSQKLGVFEVADPHPGKASARWQIELTPGDHTLEVLAYTRAVFGASAGVEVRYLGQIELPTLYVLSVGVSKYPEPYTLYYAHKDAEAVADVCRTHAKGLFKKIEVKVLTDAQATRAGILDGLDWLRRGMTQKDFGVFFFAGHGVKDERDVLYFLPVDFDKEKLARTAIDGSVLAQELTSTVGQLTVILDACHAGAIGRNKTRGLTENLLRDLTSEEKGVAMMCSASGLEVALESNEHHHGFFTVALLEGLRGVGNGQKGEAEIKVRLSDGAVYFKQLDAYVTLRVRELSQGRQHPMTSIPRTFRDFPVTRPKEGTRE